MATLFLTSFIQVGLVATNTVMLSNRNYIGVAVCSFLISIAWSLNVKKISIGTKSEILVYSLGAMLGAISGLLLTELL